MDNNILYNIGLGLIIMVFIIGLWKLLAAPRSIKNGEELMLEFHKVRGNNITSVQGRWLWYFAFWPINRRGEQIAPLWIKNWRRFYFLVQALWWATLADFKIRKESFKLILMAFAQAFSLIFTLGFVASIAMYVKTSNFLYVAYGVFSLLLGLGISVLPWHYVIKVSVPTIKQMKYEQADKEKLIKFLYISYIIAIIIAIYDAIRILSEVYKTVRNNK